MRKRIDLKNLMTSDAKKVYERLIMENDEYIIRRAVILAWRSGRLRVEEIDVRKALDESTWRKRRDCLSKQMLGFFSSLLIFESIMTGTSYAVIQHFGYATSNDFMAIASLFAAGISSGATLAIAFYRWILRVHMHSIR